MRYPANNQILKEQVYQLYELAPMGFLATLVNSIIVFLVMKQVAPVGTLVTWLCCLLTITAFRVALVARFKHADLAREADAAKWADRFVASLALVGLAWGSIAWLPFDYSLAHQVFLAFVLGGMSAGASSTFAQVKWGFAAFSIPALGPLALHFLLFADTFHLAMACMILLFIVLLWRISLHNYRVNQTSLVLRFENDEVIQNLKQAKSDLEGLFMQLQDEIVAKNEAEAELRAYQGQLEQAVRERTADLSATNRRLQTEIEDRKLVETALRASRERLALAQKAGRVGIFDWDLIHDRVMWSAQLEELFGLKPGEVKHGYRQWARRIDRRDLSELKARFRSWVGERTTQVEFEYQFLHAGGKKRWMAASAEISYLENGKPARMIGTNVDVTDLKEIQERLTAAKEAAEAGNLAKSEFLANMSHEMRTPLAGTLGMIRYVLDLDIGDEARQLLDMARRSAESLLRILGDVLDFARLESGAMKFEVKPFPVRDAVRTAVEVVSLQAVEKGLRLEWQVADSVQEMVADEGRVRQVLVNLLSNAVKFTEQGRIDLEVADAPKSGDSGADCIRFSVRDTGVGIASDQLQRIFGKFTQVDSSLTRKQGGTGLGLALSQQIVEKSGGRIWVESTPGTGTTFHFTLPVNGGACAERPEGG
jgi:PAS domain S-box-containing protein